MGKRQFNYDLLNPITNVDLLNKSYNITEHMLKENNWEYLQKFSRKYERFGENKEKINDEKDFPKGFL